MSLINDMLRSLGNRPTPVISNTLEGIQYAESKTFKWNKYFIYLFFVFFLIAGLLSEYYYGLLKHIFNETSSSQTLTAKADALSLQNIPPALPVAQIPLDFPRSYIVPLLPEWRKIFNEKENITAALNENNYENRVPGYTSNAEHFEETPVYTRETDEISQVKKIYRPLSEAQREAAYYRKALKYLDQGKQQNAVALLQDILSQNPAYHPAREALIGIMLEQKNQNEANTLIKEGLSIEPDYLPFVQTQAQLLVDANQLQEALKLLKNQSPNIVTYPDYYAMLAVVYQKLNDARHAGSIYQALVKINPQKAIYWLGLGISLEQIQKPQLAVNAYQKALYLGNIPIQLRSYAASRIQSLQG